MKQLEIVQMESLQGGGGCNDTSAFIIGGICAGAALTGPFGLLVFGPACLGGAYGLWEGGCL